MNTLGITGSDTFPVNRFSNWQIYSSLPAIMSCNSWIKLCLRESADWWVFRRIFNRFSFPDSDRVKFFWAFLNSDCVCCKENTDKARLLIVFTGFSSSSWCCLPPFTYTPFFQPGWGIRSWIFVVSCSSSYCLVIKRKLCWKKKNTQSSKVHFFNVGNI